jgi:hypothetical protein
VLAAISRRQRSEVTSVFRVVHTCAVLVDMRRHWTVGIVALIACDAGKKRPAPAPSHDASVRNALPAHMAIDAAIDAPIAAPMPTTTMGQPVLTGAIDKETVRKLVKREIQKIMYCYERPLLDTPDLFGTVTVKLVISPSGDVAHATATGVDPAVSSCVEKVFAAIKFPASRDGAQVNYPITFRPAGRPAGRP